MNLQDKDDAIEALRTQFEASLQLPEQYIPQKPTPHQAVFLLAPQKEVFYGGAAAGGKSSALLMAGLQYVENPNYRGVIIRRTFKDLSAPGALIDRSHEWLSGTDAKWNNQEHWWRFPSGAILKFGHMESENDKFNYQGTEYQFVGYDELTQFTEPMYTYLFSRMRRTMDKTGIPTRMRGAGNPGGIGHEWVKKRFKTDLEENPELLKKRCFIPAKLQDNKHVDSEDYRESLEELDAMTRAQLLNGDWDIEAAGNLFKREWFDGRIIPFVPHNVKLIRKMRYWDLASTDEEKSIKNKGEADYTASCLVGLGDDGQVYVLEMTRDRLSPAAVESLVKTKAERDGKLTTVYMEQEPGSSGVGTISYYGRYVLLGYPFYGDRPTGNKIERARPASSASELGFINLCSGTWVEKFLSEATAFPIGTHDDMVDSFTGAFSKISQGAIIGKDYKNIRARRRQKKKIWG